MVTLERLPIRSWIAAISLCITASRASAQSAEAESLFNDGNALMSQGKLAEACDAFAASNRIEARAGTLIRLGECREENHQLASAWSAYKDALARVKDPRKKQIAEAKIAEIEPRLSHLTIHVAAATAGLQLTRNGEALDNALWNRAVPIDGGDYVIAARAPGRAAWDQEVHVPEASGAITVEVPELAVPASHPPPPPAAPSPAPAPRSTPAVDRVESPGMFTTRREIALGAAGVAVAGAVVGAVLGHSAKAKQNDAFAICSDPSVACGGAARANQLLDDGRHLALEANIAFGVAGVAAIAAGVLWMTGAPVAPTASGDRVGLAFAGTF